MGIFDLFKGKRSKAIARQKNSNGLELYTKSIPENIRKLLYISDSRTMVNNNRFNDDFIAIVSSYDYEPSEIVTSLPINKGHAEPLGYYPSYYDMTPEQRYKYLEFLTDINNASDIGYVFVFYYGLERKIYSDDDLYDAVDMIIRLQKKYDNSSFIAYSNDALIYAAMKKNDPNILLNINLDKLRPELLFLVKGSFIGELNVEDLMILSKGVGFTNNRYIKNESELFKEKLTEILIQKYDSATYRLDKSVKIDTHEKIRLVLSNISLDDREFEYPNTLLVSKYQSDIYLLLKEAHEITKKELAVLRKSNNKSSDRKTDKKKTASKESFYVPNDDLTLKERILLSKEPVLDGFEEEIKGFDYYKLGEYEEAEKWLLRAVKGNFNAPVLYERLGILYRKQKRYKDEVEILKIGIENVGYSPKLNKRLARAIEINEKSKIRNLNS